MIDMNSSHQSTVPMGKNHYQEAHAACLRMAIPRERVGRAGPVSEIRELGRSLSPALIIRLETGVPVVPTCTARIAERSVAVAASGALSHPCRRFSCCGQDVDVAQALTVCTGTCTYQALLGTLIVLYCGLVVGLWLKDQDSWR
jgi:hypothetical protein